MQTKQILKEVLAELTPENGSLKDVKAFVERINKKLRKNRVKARAVVGGSFAKGTWLKGDHDVDIFVLFDMKYAGKELSSMLESALKGAGASRVHGSRDYFQAKNRINFEIIPVLDIKKPKDAQNVTDFSPKHVYWTNKKGKNLKGEIMLAKKFMKAQEAYGAESYIRGFSGHVVDILVIHYKGFMRLLRQAGRWKPKQIIDHNNIYKGRALLMLNKSKLQSPLVLIDPIQPERNAAAALSEKNFRKFVSAAKKFVKRPSKSFFAEKRVDFAKLAKKGNLVIVKGNSLKGKEDVIGTKLFKVFEFLDKNLAEFRVVEKGWSWDKKKSAMFWFVLKNKSLSKTMLWQGPPVRIDACAKQFKKKHKKTFSKKGRLWATVKRKFRTPDEKIRELLKSSYAKERIKGTKLK